MNYLSEEYQPKHVWDKKRGFIWLEPKNQLVIVKCTDERIVEAFIDSFSKHFNSKYWKFQLSRQLLEQIFNADDKIKSNYRAKFDEEELPKGVSLFDVRLSNKEKDPRFNFIMKFDQTFSKYFTIIEGFTHKVNVNISCSGKISLIGKGINISACRGWLIKILVKIIKIQEELLNTGDIDSLFSTTTILERSGLFERVKSKKARKVLKDLIVGVVKLKEAPGEESFNLELPVSLLPSLGELLNPVIEAACTYEECIGILRCPSESCDSTHFEVKRNLGNKFSIICSKCGIDIPEDSTVYCVSDNHQCQFNYQKVIFFIFSFFLKQQINTIFQENNISFSINNDMELFFINDNRLYRKEITEKLAYDWRELPAFSGIPSIKEMAEDAIATHAEDISTLWERCAEDRKGKCRTCSIPDSNTRLCMGKVFAYLSDGQPHPHTGLEFGDFSFPQLFSSNLEYIVGIAKSYRKPKKPVNPIDGIYFDTLTFMKDDRLFNQVYDICNISSVRFIMIVSGRILESRLKDHIIDVARWKRKKITLIEPEELIPILKRYWDLQAPSAVSD